MSGATGRWGRDGMEARNRAHARRRGRIAAAARDGLHVESPDRIAAGALRQAVLVGALALAGAGCADGQEPANAAGLNDTTLVRVMAEIQPAVERSSGIRASAPLRVALTDEARLRAYIGEQLERQLPPEEAEAVTALYARLGLVPDTLDLRALLGALLEEQVVGYYDPERDTLFVHARVPLDQLEPVLAHELVHALQDQHVALDSVRSVLEDRNDAMAAYQAAVEGHATYAMMEWQAAMMTGGEADLTAMPDLGELLAGMDLAALGDIGPAEILRSAPAIIREALVFPYIGGLAFVQRAWKARPDRPLPFGERLPRSTEQVLHVERWLEGDAPTPLRFSSDSPAGWRIVYEKDMGELETRIFLARHLGDEERAASAAEGWDGDAYRLFRSPEGEALVWVSVWDSEADAQEFAAAARDAYEARYADGARQPLIERASVAGRPAVRILDLPAWPAPAGLAAVTLVGG